MSNNAKILIVDDDGVTRGLLTEVLEKQGYSTESASTGEEAIRAIKREVYSVVISDIRMLETDGMAVLRAVKASGARTAVILMTGFGSMEGAIEAIQEGAFDYVSKPFKIDELKSIVARAIEHVSLLQASPKSRVSLAPRALTGKCAKIVEVYKTVARAALSHSSVLILGEKGTGKALVARAIHDNGLRRKGVFQTIDCTQTLAPRALADALGTRELQGGTLFLESVGALSESQQLELLRYLEASDQKPSVRIIASDRASRSEQTRIREDLFYLLKVITVELPPLRERTQDLPDLIEEFIARYSAKNEKQISHVSEEAMAILRAYPWPGNIRELENAIERAIAMAKGSVLYPEDFSSELSRAGSGAQRGSLEEIERAHILKVLQDTSFNKSRASEILGIDRATLYRKAQRYGLDLHREK